ncbi:MAG: prolipoprotein diacylglyceryl transferase [Ruminococcaceae bacterium]|nr:prolipoprotein diacylglyceryl transferase [Oscillospiraceae bacterium]
MIILYQYISFVNFCIPSYGLMMSVGVLLCGFLILIKGRRKGLGSEEIIIVMAMSLGMALFGAGLLYILVSYSIKDLINGIVNGDFAFLKNGGLVFYGGLVGGIIGSILASQWQQLDVMKVESCIIPVLPLGHAIGRIGCLLAGCCHGIEYTGPLAVKNLLISAEKTYFPIQAVEALLNVSIFIFLLWYTRKKHPTYHILCVYLYFYSILRFILEFFRGDLIRGGFSILSTSQWISVVLFLGSTFGFYIFREQKITK